VNTDKYETITTDSIMVGSRRLYRIRALRDVGQHARAGDLGGYIGNAESLSQEGDCWISASAKVFDKAEVHENAVVRDRAVVAGGAIVKGNACVAGHAEVMGRVLLAYEDRIEGKCRVFHIKVERCSQLVRNGETLFTFLYYLGSYAATCSIPANLCSEDTAIQLSLLVKDCSLTASVGPDGVVSSVPLNPATGFLDYLDVVTAQIRR
jgi:hypothetical protein